MEMTRRQAIIPCLFTVLCLLYSFTRCSSPIGPDFSLSSGDEESLAREIAGKHDFLLNLAQHPGKKLQIEYAPGQVLTLSFVDEPFLYTVFERPDGETVYPKISIGRDPSGGPLVPTVEFRDIEGRFITRDDGTRLQFFLTSKRASEAGGWFALGLSVVAAGFAVWLGAEVGGLVLAAIAFLAFNAMVIGLLITAASLVVPYVDLILGWTGWDWSSAHEFFGMSVEEIKELLLRIRDGLDL